jgi:outer membrane protein OmpA-like peptidoglycan-associated protein
LIGLGGYDFFFAKLDSNDQWSTPKNIGYPINSFEDDIGFFVSTDGHYGYFASNKFDGFGGWDLYSFDLYKEARPERVLFVKGDIRNEEKIDFKNARVELTNVNSKKVTRITVDTVTGEYVAAVLFRDDYVLTIRHKGYVNESKYLARIDPRTVNPIHYPVKLEPIEVGKSYRLNDVFFDFNSYDLLPESMAVIREFYDFLQNNPKLKISIEGHTDEIGNDQDNLELSIKRARSVYNHLIQLGIDPGRISYKGFGESRPVTDNRSEEGRALNRRTEFVIVSK